MQNAVRIEAATTPVAAIAYSPMSHSAINSANLKRWLVVVDVLPDIGPINNFYQVDAPRRTLNVVPKRRLDDAVLLVRNSARQIGQMVREMGMLRPFRYNFVILDMLEGSVVTIDRLVNQFGAFAAGAGELPPAFDKLGLHRAAAIARLLNGKEIPSSLFLDGTDPIKVFRSLGLLKYPTAGGDQPGLYNYSPEASKQIADALAKKKDDRVWLDGLNTLPALIAASLDRVTDARLKLVMGRLQRSGVHSTSPRMIIIPEVFERTLAKMRDALVQEVRRRVIVNSVEYSDSGKLDLVVDTVCTEMLYPNLPSYTQIQDDADVGLPNAAVMA